MKEPGDDFLNADFLKDPQFVLACWEFLCALYGKQRPTRVVRVVTISSENDPKGKEGSLSVEMVLTNGEMEHWRDLVAGKRRR